MSGKKFGRHSTHIETKAATKAIRAAEKHPQVSKISFGRLRRVGNAPSRISFKPINGGIQVVIRETSSIQDIMVYTTAPKAVQKAMRAAFEGR